jgi:hypothetical protein
MNGIKHEITCSACPVQVEGTIDEVPFYFRSRWGHWRIGIGGDVVGDPDWTRQSDYGDGAYDASWMPEEEALEIIERCANEWRMETGRSSPIPKED